jgi:lysophospholipid acyltransferase (LPLAT)-like uncharacterized protein
MLFLTCRLRVGGGQYLQDVVRQGGAIGTFWHYSILFMFYHLRAFPAAVMVSASKDGEYIARLAELLGHTPVRGSSNKRGVAALKHLLREVRSGKNAGIVADGSQGPARKAQAGAVLLASMVGRPILPMVWASTRYKAFHSWDQTVIPLPFCRIFFEYGEPLHVPKGVKGDDVEKYRLELENRLNHIYETAWGKAGQQAHDLMTEG